MLLSFSHFLLLSLKYVLVGGNGIINIFTCGSSGYFLRLQKYTEFFLNTKKIKSITESVWYMWNVDE